MSGEEATRLEVLVLASAGLSSSLIEALHSLAERGAVLRLGRFGAVPSAGVPWASLRRPQARTAVRGWRAVGLRGVQPLLPSGTIERLNARYDPWVRRALEVSTVVVLADDVAADAVSRSLGRVPRSALVIPPMSDPGPVLRSVQAWQDLGRLLAQAEASRHSVRGETISRVLAAVQECAGVLDVADRDPMGTVRPLTTLADRWLRSGRAAAVIDLTSAVRGLRTDGTSSLDDALGLSALEQCARIARRGPEPADLSSIARDAPGVAGRVLQAAEKPWALGDVEHTAALVTSALRLLFHPDLHAEVASTPLISNPDTYLAPVRGTPLWQVLCGPARGLDRAAPEPANDGDSGPTRVLVLPGAYPRFAAPLIETLRSRCGVEVRVRVLGDDDKTFRWLGVNQTIVRMRLRAAAHPSTPPESPALEDLAWADVVIADWADRGAVWASLEAPRRARLIVRVHSTDALGPWLHLIDWSAVDGAWFVSDPVRELTADLLGDRAPERLTVVGNGVDLSRFRTAGSGVDCGARALRTVAMVGWARAVKDPVFALEVLAGLVAAEPDEDWRLRLIGPDFAESGTQATHETRRVFRARLLEQDVRDRVDFVGETARPEQHLADVGFVMSASLRESFHVAIVEGVAAGAVPVVRDWPALATRDGAARIYPREWVVADVAAAVGRILALATPVKHREAAARAGTALVDEVGVEGFADRVLEAVTGRSGRSADSNGRPIPD